MRLKTTRHIPWWSSLALGVVPLVFAFDLLVFFLTRTSCVQCSTFGEFFRSNSLAGFILSNSYYQFFGKQI